MLIAGIIVTVLVGKPVSYLSCPQFPTSGNTANFLNSLFTNVKNINGNVYTWVDADKATCFELKAVWGLCIALCVMFAFSAIISICLWKRLRPVSAPAPGKEDFE